MSEPSATPALKRTPLYDLHVELGAKMVPFAGYEMPVQYAPGVLKEHLWTREKAGLFDVSHMGQAFLKPKDGRFETAARALETLVPADVVSLKPNQQRYSQFTNAEGGILDDLMITQMGFSDKEPWLYLVVNAACKDADFARLQALLPDTVELKILADLALLALQGPCACDVLKQHVPSIANLPFMAATDVKLAGHGCHISRSGYTGEDGVEIAAQSHGIVDIARLLLADPRVAPIGLGARDSLRLEAGLCLYGHDINETTSPIEAALAWSIQKRRREEGGFPGADRIQAELKLGPSRRRVGLKPEGRAPAREGTEIRSLSGETIGTVTSGGFGPSVNAPIAMGYVATPSAKVGTPVDLIVRGKALRAHVAPLPFMPHRYAKTVNV